MGILNTFRQTAILRNPLFLTGLALRILLIAFITSSAISGWYAPFLESTVAAGTLDPWSSWLQSGGAIEAFPYGYAMWLAFVPAVAACQLLGVDAAVGYSSTLLLVDFALLMLLRRMLPGREKLLLIAYWFSPIIIVSTYVLGFNDLVPVSLLVLSTYLLSRARPGLSALVLAAAVSAKLSMLIAVPFFFIYLMHNRAVRQWLPTFTAALAAGGALVALPYIISTASLNMIQNSPEVDKIYRLFLTLGDGTVIYLVPFAYLMVLYAAWRVRRPNFSLFQALLGLSFLVVVLMTPASPGWYIWVVPVLVIYQLSSDKAGLGIVGLFSALFVVNALAFSVDSPTPGSDLASIGGLSFPLSPDVRAASITYTALVAVGGLLVLRIWRQMVQANDYFRLSRKPLVIGIAGDSGSGKDTLADGLRGLFGSQSVAVVSGDNYHLWDRRKPMWQALTPLNPAANDLTNFEADVLALADGRNVMSSWYDHSTGVRSRGQLIRANDIVVAAGLHALYLPLLRRCFSLSIYLDMDESLRRYLKVRRDTLQRGHERASVIDSIARREADSERFIRPQAQKADLVLSVQPTNPGELDDGAQLDAPRVKLKARSRQGIDGSSLTRVLIGVCGLHVDTVALNDGMQLEMTIEGEPSGADIEMAAKMVCPRVIDFLDAEIEWEDGVLGLMQLITLVHINQALAERLL